MVSSRHILLQRNNLKMLKLLQIISLSGLLLLLPEILANMEPSTNLLTASKQSEHEAVVNLTTTNSPAHNRLTNDSSGSQQRQQHGARLKRRLKSSKLPEFAAPIGNVTAVEGRDVRLICTVENLGQYQVAWLKEESKTILSIDTNIIITNYRIFLIPDEEERKWVLHIKDVQESDRGFYQCQVNTNPMRSTSGYLEVVVPPTIIESQSTKVAEVIEHSDVSLQCKANGHPRPTITWRRDDGAPIRLNGASIGQSAGNSDETLSASTNQTSSLSSLLATNTTTNSNRQTSSLSQLTDVKSDKLSMKSVDRFMAGIYVCTAWNGIPSQVSKRIPFYVKFPPKTSVSNKYISVSLGQELEIDCIIEAFPKANSYWSKKPLSSLQDARGLWMDRARWLHSGGRATLYRAKQILQPIDESTNDTTTQSDSSSVMDEDSSSEGQPLTSDQSSIGESKRMSLTANSRRDSMSSLSGNFQSPSTSLLSSASKPDASLADRVATNHQPPSGSKAYVSVKQTPVNTFTYKLRLSIAQMQLDDYGEYTCVSTNSIGVSESKVMVTKADKQISEITDRPDFRSSLGEDDYGERDSVADQAQRPGTINGRQQSGITGGGGGGGGGNNVRRGSAYGGNRVVYDGNYLQAIKTRQSNLIGSNKQQLQQNLKLRQFADRNAASHPSMPFVWLTVIIALGLKCVLRRL